MSNRNRYSSLFVLEEALSSPSAKESHQVIDFEEERSAPADATPIYQVSAGILLIRFRELYLPTL